MNLVSSKKTDINERFVWVIKDEFGRFAHRNSIRKISNTTAQYIRHKTFSYACKGYKERNQAEKALTDLNKQRDITGFDVYFHLENPNLIKIIMENHDFKGDNTLISRMEFKPKLKLYFNKVI